MLLKSILETAGAELLDVRFVLDRLPDSRTWTYKPTAWRLPDGAWTKVNVEPMQIGDIRQTEVATGFKMVELGFKLSTFDWIYQFKKAS